MAAADFTSSMSDVPNMFSVVSACLLPFFSNALFALFRVCVRFTLLKTIYCVARKFDDVTAPVDIVSKEAYIET